MIPKKSRGRIKRKLSAIAGLWTPNEWPVAFSFGLVVDAARMIGASLHNLWKPIVSKGRAAGI
jgi:hypothetical protein